MPLEGTSALGPAGKREPEKPADRRSERLDGGSVALKPGVTTGVAVPSALASRGAVPLPDGIEKAVQVELFRMVTPLGIEMPGWVSVMFFPVTDSLGGTIAENCASYMPHAMSLLLNDIGSSVAGARPSDPIRKS